MSLISNGINSIQAFSIAVGSWPDGREIQAPQTAMVKWHSILKDVYYQVYVNGRYSGTTFDTEQRQMIVPVPTSFNSAIRIEVFAVQPKHADMDLSHEISESITDGGRVKISLLRGQNLPAGATALIYYDSGTGQIDYENPVNETPIRIWPTWHDKAGFGMSGCGLGDFGYDSAGAVGFGKGCFGQGQFGLDADTIQWISPTLSAGVYRFAIKVIDHVGNESSIVETEPVTLTPMPRPAEKLEIISYDKEENQLVLEIT
jgi:hypothetical protein